MSAGSSTSSSRPIGSSPRSMRSHPSSARTSMRIRGRCTPTSNSKRTSTATSRWAATASRGSSPSSRRGRPTSSPSLPALGVTCPTTIPAGSVVINEFEADNTQILDPAGDAEDWIEMYNNSDEPLNLFGLHMTDDPAAPMKWQIPAGTIDRRARVPHRLGGQRADRAGTPRELQALRFGRADLVHGHRRRDHRFGEFRSADDGSDSMARLPNGSGSFSRGRRASMRSTGS